MADSSDRKTLTLKPRASGSTPDSRDAPRVRSGARARKVAQRQAGDPVASDDRRPKASEAHRPDGPKPRGNASSRAPRDHEERRPRAGTRPPREGAPRDDTRPGTRAAPSSARGPRPGAPRDRSTPPQPREGRRDPVPAHSPRDTLAPTDEAGPMSSHDPNTRYAAFAPCPPGLEAVLTAELRELGMDDVKATRAGCHFRTTWPGMMRANLYSRIATRILLRVAHGPVSTEDDLLALARQTPWERWFGPEQRLRVDTSAVRSPFTSLQYCTLRTKDGICDRLREREGARPDIDTVRPDARVHVFLDARNATLYLDTSGESLFKRGWRFDKGAAPLRENLAAGLLALAGWDGTMPLLDPFCGSGTILIEAAHQALRIAPGGRRPFSFERLRGHDAVLWHELKDEARAAERDSLGVPLIGSDIDPDAIRSAQANLARAGLPADLITWEVRDARELRPTPGAPGWILTNPPYGDRLSLTEAVEPQDDAPDRPDSGDQRTTGDAAGMWSEFAQTLKAHFDGWRAGIITTDRELPRHMRLTPRQRIPLYNGALDCRLFLFDVVGGSYRQKL